MVALQREAKLTGERLRVFVVLNFSCSSTENYDAGTGRGRADLFVQVRWNGHVYPLVAVRVKRCGHGEGCCVCQESPGRCMSSDYLMSGRDSCFCLTIVAGPVGGRTNVFETLCAGKLLVGTCH